jgi:hypothetical protein
MPGLRNRDTQFLTTLIEDLKSTGEPGNGVQYRSIPENVIAKVVSG